MRRNHDDVPRPFGPDPYAPFRSAGHVVACSWPAIVGNPACEGLKDR
jgi:hypothetical protein